MHLSPPSAPPDDDDAVTGFEGPEKRLEVHFSTSNKQKRGLCGLPEDLWQDGVLKHARCTIIRSTRNDTFDSFVLSESSLFVYPHRVILKTCGTIPLLHSLQALVEFVRKVLGQDADVDLLLYSRKNLNFPKKQYFPHITFEDEVTYLNKMFEGRGHTLGPVNKDHWNLFVADRRPLSSSPLGRTSQTFEVMMHDLAPHVMQQFFKREGVSVGDTTLSSGIAGLLPGSLIDDFQFEPCGYSMNGLLKDWYWTIHITPEAHCSYVSFETNVPLPTFSRILRKVFKVFQPGRAVVAILADHGAPCGDLVSSFDPNVLGFEHVGYTLQTFPNHYSVMACNFVADVN